MFTLRIFLIVVASVLLVQTTYGYSPRRDARIIAEYREAEAKAKHAKVARQLVHQANWAALGSLSYNTSVSGYPMVNIISIDDNDERGHSTGRIRFMLTDLDFTGPDWEHDNKVTLLFTDEQTLNCKADKKDPMEPTCARTMISGQVKRFSKDDEDYESALRAFIQRHPAANNWMKAHLFYLCELNIKNIFVLDFYGGPHTVTATDYYAVNL